MPQTRRAEERLPQGSAGLNRQPAEDIVQDGQTRKDAEVLKGPGDSQPGHLVGGQPGDINAFEADGPGVGADDPGEAVDEGGFAGAVGADERSDLPRRDAERHVSQGRQAAEIFAEVGNLQQVFAHEPNPLSFGPTKGRTR